MRSAKIRREFALESLHEWTRRYPPCIQTLLHIFPLVAADFRFGQGNHVTLIKRRRNRRGIHSNVLESIRRFSSGPRRGTRRVPSPAPFWLGYCRQAIDQLRFQKG